MKNIKDDRVIVSVKVGEKGQIVIPKIAREMFNINPQDTVMILGDKEKGLAMCFAKYALGNTCRYFDFFKEVCDEAD